MFTLNVVFYIAAVFVVCYLPRIFAWFGAIKPQEHLINEKKNRIALIIPARNEGKAVLPLFDSIKRQTYSKENFDVFVVVKESDDPVIGYAKEYGINSLVVADQKSKGEALDGAIKHILAGSKKFDAYMIVDADCILDEHYMEEMNNALKSGAKVINAKKLVSNYYTNEGKNSNIVTASNGLIWTFMDDMGNRFKSDHGYTTMTVSTGIMFAADLVESWGGWIYNKTMTEDMELERDCALNNYKTYYCSYAKLYMQEAPELAETNKRRSRWMTGLTLSDFIYGPKVLKRFDLYSLANNYYLFCLWIVYAFVTANFVVGVTNFVGFLVSLIFFHTFSFNMIWVMLASVLSVYMAFWCLTLTALIVDRKNIKLSFFKWICVLFYHPAFYMGYIPIVAKAIIFKKESEWVEIKRTEDSVAAEQRV